jgi:RNA polymerase sigma-70 factor, ECF subfamily
VAIGAFDDEDLAAALSAAISGDERAFARLWRALHPGLLRYLRVVVGDGADDVASETWLQVARDMADFRGGPTAFRIWLYRVARNRGIDEHRRAGRRREDPRELSVAEQFAPPAPDAAAEVIEATGTGWALRLIATLPPDQAEAVMLRVVAGLDVAATAKVLGKRPGAVRVAAMRGLRRLAVHPEVRGAREGRWAAPPVPFDEPRPEGV